MRRVPGQERPPPRLIEAATSRAGPRTQQDARRAAAAASCCRYAVGTFVSYYGYYRPETYVPQTDTPSHRERILDPNDEVPSGAPRRHERFQRAGTVVVSSVSCILRPQPGNTWRA